MNGISAKTGGGVSILTNFLSIAMREKGDDEYLVLTPTASTYSRYSSSTVTIVDVPNRYKHSFMFPILQAVVIPKLIQKLACDRVLNLADVPIPTSVHQCYLFDWPYAIYPESQAWKRMRLKDWLVRKAKLLFLRHYARYPSVTVAQTQTARNRLVQQFKLPKVIVIPNAVSLDHVNVGDTKDFAFCTNRIKFLCLSYYYTHKNLEVFLSLGEKIKQQALPYLIVTTIGENDNVGARKFLRAVRSLDLGDVILNIGPVSMTDVPSLYSQCDALLLPTLLESFSGTYVEAMFHRRPILTSDFDFARDICEDDAYYFNPLNPDSILDAMKQMLADPEASRIRTSRAAQRVKQMPGWGEVFRMLRKALG